MVRNCSLARVKAKVNTLHRLPTYVPYSWKIWQFGSLLCNSQIKIRQYFLLMVIPYRTAKFKSAHIFAMVIWAQLPNLIPANISGIRYVVRLRYENFYLFGCYCTMHA